MREIALLNNDSERARELNQLQKDKLAKLEQDNKVLLARLREELLTSKLLMHFSNGSADMLNALANFSKDTSARLTDNSTIVTTPIVSL